VHAKIILIFNSIVEDPNHKLRALLYHGGSIPPMNSEFMLPKCKTNRFKNYFIIADINFELYILILILYPL
jgi:hypothetical protein